MMWRWLYSGVSSLWCGRKLSLILILPSVPPEVCPVYSFDGILVFGLLFICTCAYFKKVPRLNSWLLSEKKGVWGVFYKGHAAEKSPHKTLPTMHQMCSELLYFHHQHVV
ncbi:Protein kish-B [Nibea albiflora]|uniref:Protein kish-B n=1 Tax=Nibea albiflora TaxID=240163 RepID=A0ACB7EZ85_NIBAL|nr:Protein kish-B [Nibea albiflora]